MNGPTGTPFKRTAIVSVLAILSTGATMLLPGFASAQEAFVNGSGKAKAQIIRVGPSAGQLSLAPAAGVALADHLGVLGRGESLVFDYAALDGTVQDDVRTGSEGNIDPKGKQLPPLRAECTVNRCDGYLRAENVPGVVQEAEAKAKPSGGQGEILPDGFSAASLQAFEIPGVVKVSGGRATSFSGVFKEGSGKDEKILRRAGGTVDIGQVELLGLGNPFILRGLHWEVVQVTDKNDDDKPDISGKFVVGQAVVNGETHDGPITGDHVKQLFDGLNAGFAAMGPGDPGIRFQPPTVTQSGQAGRIGSLTIQVADSNLGKSAVGPVAGGFQPVRDGVTEGYIDGCIQFNQGADPETGDIGGPFPCGLPLLVSDVTIGVLSGAGRLDVDLGGVLGVTEGQIFDSFNLFATSDFGDLDKGGFALPSEPATSGGLGTSVLGNDVTAPIDTGDGAAAPPAAQGGGTELAVPQGFKLTGSRASAAWAVGLVGLGAALAMAATDYRRLRMRRRAVTPIT